MRLLLALSAGALALLSVPVRAQLSVAEQTRLFASDARASARFGWAIAAAADVMFVCAPGQPSSPLQPAGAVYELARDGVAWRERARLQPSDPAQAYGFGDSVGFSGATLVVGAAYQDGERGCAYVFVRDGSGWRQEARLVASDRMPGDLFGSAVACSGDRIVVGAPRDGTSTLLNGGAGYVFQRTGTTWTQQVKLVPVDVANDHTTGAAVAIDGDFVVLGAECEDTSASSGRGAAYVFARESGVWNQRAKLQPPGGLPRDSFGISVAIAGETVVVGAPGHDLAGPNAGAAFAFTRFGLFWPLEAPLVPGVPEEHAAFGYSVAFDGVRAAIGAPGATVQGEGGAGSARLFERSGVQWNPLAELVADQPSRERAVGWTLAVAGPTVLSGTPWDDAAGGDAGAVYVHCFLAAAALPRNAGANPAVYTAAPPVLGQSTTLRVAHSGYSTALVLACAEPAATVLPSGFVLLVSPGSGIYFRRALALPVGTATLPVPNDPALCSLVAHTQAVLLRSGGAFGLTNAVDLVLGY